MKKILFGCLAITALSGCGIFDKDPLDVTGERVSVIRENRNIKPDYSARQIQVRLPRAKINYAWEQSGMTATHKGDHLKSGGNLDEIWDISFGEGSSKRNVLISAPVTDSKNVYTIDAEGVVRSFSLADGEELWEKKLKPSNKKAKDNSMSGAGIALKADKLFVTTGFGQVFALNKTDGNIVWNHDIKSPIRIAPSVDDELVIVQSLDNGIFALNINNGKELWSDKLEEESTTMIGGGTPAYSVGKDLVIAVFSNGQVQAYKASTGTQLWSEWVVPASSTESLSDITAIKANPIIDNDVVYIVGYNGPMVAIDIRTGAKVWQKDVSSSSQPWLAGNFLFVLTKDSDLVAINKQNGKVIWTTIIPYANDDEKIGVFTSGPILANDALLVASSNGKLFSVSPYNGRIMGIADIEEGVESSPIMANETLLITTKDAEITAYK